MMDLSSLKPVKGSTKNRKRVGRGQGSGRGGTSTRGHNGAQSRSGYSRNPGFEGGQMPLMRLLPKFGFKNVNRVSYTAVNLNSIQELAEKKNLTVIDIQNMVDAGFASKSDKIKVLGNGELKLKLHVKAHGFSAKAKEAIEKLEGTAEVI